MRTHGTGFVLMIPTSERCEGVDITALSDHLGVRVYQEGRERRKSAVCIMGPSQFKYIASFCMISIGCNRRHNLKGEK